MWIWTQYFFSFKISLFISSIYHHFLLHFNSFKYPLRSITFFYGVGIWTWYILFLNVMYTYSFLVNCLYACWCRCALKCSEDNYEYLCINMCSWISVYGYEDVETFVVLRFRLYSSIIESPFNYDPIFNNTLLFYNKL